MYDSYPFENVLFFCVLPFWGMYANIEKYGVVGLLGTLPRKQFKQKEKK